MKKKIFRRRKKRKKEEYVNDNDEEDYMNMRLEEEVNNEKRKLRRTEKEEKVNKIDIPLGEENKGFHLLKKMGFKTSSTLGNASTKPEDALSTPLGIETPLKRGKKPGLGFLEKEKEEAKMKQEEKEMYEKNRALLEEENLRTFRSQVKEKQEMKKNKGILKAICRTICSLENDNEMETNRFLKNLLELEEKVEWKEEVEEEEEEENGNNKYLLIINDIMNPNELMRKKIEAMDYLRLNHFYCFYCGRKYENEKEMEEICPGREEEDHE